MRFLALIIVIVLSINLNGQIGISGIFKNSDFRSGGCYGNYTDNAEFIFYPDFTFIYLQYKCNLDAISSLYSSGTYNIHSDTIKLTSLRNDPNLKPNSGFIKKHINGMELFLMDVPFEDLSGKWLFLNKNILNTNNLIGHFDRFYSKDLEGKKLISVRHIIPSNLSPFGGELELNPNDSYDVYQLVDEYTHRIAVKNDTIVLLAIDSSKIIVKSHEYYNKFKAETIDYVHRQDIKPVLKYNCNLLPDNHNPCEIPTARAELIERSHGRNINVREYLLKTGQISQKKCIKMLFASLPLKNLRISYSDSIKLNCQSAEIFNLMNVFGAKYINEFYKNYETSVISFKSKPKGDFLISKPAFSDNKIFAIIMTESLVDHKSPKYLLFERRIDNYQLIGELSDNLLKLNGLSIFVN